MFNVVNVANNVIFMSGILCNNVKLVREQMKFS